MRFASPLTSGLLLGAALLTAPPALAQRNTWALTNARIQTISHGTIEKGTIVIRDGLIAAVGANVAVPPDARVLDLSGRTVYPGLIDLTSSIGLEVVAAPQGGRGGGGAAFTTASQTRPRFVGLEPSRSVAEEINPSAADLEAARNAGITAVLVAPTRGAFRGLSALLPTREDSAAKYLLRAPVGLHMGFQGAQGRYPATLLGVIAYERQELYDAQRQAAMLDRFRANPRTPRPESDADLDALVPVVRGTLPAFFAANNENEIRRAVNIAKEFNLKLTIVGATEGFRALDALKGGRPVVVSVDYPNASEMTGWPYHAAQRREPNDSAVRSAAARKLAEGNAATLNQAGVKFALASGTLRPNEFVANVRRAIAAGLPRAAALEALTIRPAEIAGVAEQLGTIDQGKVANLVVTQGELLTDSVKVRLVFVDGIRHEVIEAPPAGRGGRGGRGAGGAPAQMAGTWALALTSPQGQNDATLTITQSGDTFTGTLTSQMGSVPVADGRIDGSNVSWTITTPMGGGQPITITFDGQVEGSRMTGRASMGQMGNMTFTAERRP
jgi:imidazolonepropionase-like amidohydrolase